MTRNKTRKTSHIQFMRVTEKRDLLSINEGVPVDRALCHAMHLLGDISIELEQASIEPMSESRAFLLFNLVEQAHALVASCVDSLNDQ